MILQKASQLLIIVFSRHVDIKNMGRHLLVQYPPKYFKVGVL